MSDLHQKISPHGADELTLDQFNMDVSTGAAQTTLDLEQGPSNISHVIRDERERIENTSAEPADRVLPINDDIETAPLTAPQKRLNFASETEPTLKPANSVQPQPPLNLRAKFQLIPDQSRTHVEEAVIKTRAELDIERQQRLRQPAPPAKLIQAMKNGAGELKLKQNIPGASGPAQTRTQESPKQSQKITQIADRAPARSLSNQPEVRRLDDQIERYSARERTKPSASNELLLEQRKEMPLEQAMKLDLSFAKIGAGKPSQKLSFRGHSIGSGSVLDRLVTALADLIKKIEMRFFSFLDRKRFERKLAKIKPVKVVEPEEDSLHFESFSSSLSQARRKRRRIFSRFPGFSNKS